MMNPQIIALLSGLGLLGYVLLRKEPDVRPAQVAALEVQAMPVWSPPGSDMTPGIDDLIVAAEAGHWYAIFDTPLNPFQQETVPALSAESVYADDRRSNDLLSIRNTLYSVRDTMTYDGFPLNRAGRYETAGNVVALVSTAKGLKLQWPQGWLR